MGVLFSCNSKKQRPLGGVQEFPLHSGNLGRRLTLIGARSPARGQTIDNTVPQPPTNAPPSRRSINSASSSYFPMPVRESRSEINEQNVSDISPSSSWTPNSDLIIGIDFGTTFTGVAYAHAAGLSPVTSEADIRRVAEKISVIKTWPSRGNQFEKIPSILAYNKTPPLWGRSVRPNDEPQIAHFKLGLQEDITSHYYSESLGLSGGRSVLGGYLSNHNWTHPKLPDMRPVDYARDFLRSVNDYVTQEILPTRYGARFLQNQTLSYVITVPAIWSDKAKQQTRQAAEEAGIDKYNLTLITEPEAAALYCATLCDEVDLESGDRFMICDAGGGTVVTHPRRGRGNDCRT